MTEEDSSESTVDDGPDMTQSDDVADASSPDVPVEREAEEATPEPPARRRTRTILVASGVAAALLVASVVLLAIKVSTDASTIDAQNRLNAARSSALADAKRYAVDFTTYDYTALSAGFARTESELTGTFKKQYTSTTAALKSTIVQYKAKATSKVEAVAVQSVTLHDAVVIAFVDQTITNSTSSTPQIDRNRVQMTLHRVGSGPWLITNLQLP